MPIAFTCPHCGLQTEVAAEYAGQSGPCAGCGRTVTVVPPVGAAGSGAAGGAAAAVVAVVVIVLLVLIALLFCSGVMFWLVAARSAPMAPTPPAASATVAAVDEQAECAAALRRIGLAMQAYRAEHGRFPPAYLTDKNGQPAHSWRVLLLPYLGRKDLYDLYRFEESWDSPGNRAISQLIGSLYQCDEAVQFGGRTSYVMIVGPGTISDGPTGTRLEDIKDGVSNTILLVETQCGDIECVEPRDLRAEEIDFQVRRGMEGIGSDHLRGAHALLCDGTVRFIPHGTDPQVVRAMSTIAGGEAVALPGQACETPEWDPYAR